MSILKRGLRLLNNKLSPRGEALGIIKGAKLWKAIGQGTCGFVGYGVIIAPSLQGERYDKEVYKYNNWVTGRLNRRLHLHAITKTYWGTLS